jgi:hypothetical protein
MNIKMDSKVSKEIKRERTHSLDSLEEDDLSTKRQQEYQSSLKETQKSSLSSENNLNDYKRVYVIDARHTSGKFDVNLDINLTPCVDTNSARVELQQQQHSHLHTKNKQWDREQESELSEIPEIKIDFEYQVSNVTNNIYSRNVASNIASEPVKASLLNKHKAPIFKTINKLSTTNENEAGEDIYKVAETKINDIFNNDIVKQRTREGLKFWKDEEEKHKLNEKSEKIVGDKHDTFDTNTTKTNEVMPATQSPNRQSNSISTVSSSSNTTSIASLANNSVSNSASSNTTGALAATAIVSTNSHIPVLSKGSGKQTKQQQKKSSHLDSISSATTTITGSTITSSNSSSLSPNSASTSISALTSQRGAVDMNETKSNKQSNRTEIGEVADDQHENKETPPQAPMRRVKDRISAFEAKKNSTEYPQVTASPRSKSSREIRKSKPFNATASQQEQEQQEQKEQKEHQQLKEIKSYIFLSEEIIHSNAKLDTTIRDNVADEAIKLNEARSIKSKIESFEKKEKQSIDELTLVNAFKASSDRKDAVEPSERNCTTIQISMRGNDEANTNPKETLYSKIIKLNGTNESEPTELDVTYTTNKTIELVTNSKNCMDLSSKPHPSNKINISRIDVGINASKRADSNENLFTIDSNQSRSKSNENLTKIEIVAVNTEEKTSKELNTNINKLHSTIENYYSPSKLGNCQNFNNADSSTQFFVNENKTNQEDISNKDSNTGDVLVPLNYENYYYNSTAAGLTAGNYYYYNQHKPYSPHSYLINRVIVPANNQYYNINSINITNESNANANLSNEANKTTLTVTYNPLVGTTQESNRRALNEEQNENLKIENKCELNDSNLVVLDELNRDINLNLNQVQAENQDDRCFMTSLTINKSPSKALSEMSTSETDEEHVDLDGQDDDIEEVEIIIDLNKTPAASISMNKSVETTPAYVTKAETISSSSSSSSSSASSSRSVSPSTSPSAFTSPSSNNDENKMTSCLPSTSIEEKLFRMLLQLMPNARKVHIEKIIEQVKLKLNADELNSVSSTSSLNERLLKFIHNEYLRLLNQENFNENHDHSRYVNKQSNEVKENLSPFFQPNSNSDYYKSKAKQSHEYFSNERESPVSIAAAEAVAHLTDSNKLNLYTPQSETTELTVVKEIRKEYLSSNLYVNSGNHKLQDEESQREPDIIRRRTSDCERDHVDFFKYNEPRLEEYHDKRIRDEDGLIMKVDEDTLYIVEKKRKIASSIPANIVSNLAIKLADEFKNSNINFSQNEHCNSFSEASMTPTCTLNEIDKEIRKNFELKSRKENNITDTKSTKCVGGLVQIESLKSPPHAENHFECAIIGKSKPLDEINSSNSEHNLLYNLNKFLSDRNDMFIIEHKYDLVRTSIANALSELYRLASHSSATISEQHSHLPNDSITSEPCSLVDSNTQMSSSLNNEINDYQLHFYSLDKNEPETSQAYSGETKYANEIIHPNSQTLEEKQPILVMLFDKQNKENFKFNLEYGFHKSIMDTHRINNAEVNIIAKLNVFYIDETDEQQAGGKESIRLSNKQFEKFSLIRDHIELLFAEKNTRSKDNQIDEYSNESQHRSISRDRDRIRLEKQQQQYMRIAQYFVLVRYKHVRVNKFKTIESLSRGNSHFERSVVNDESGDSCSFDKETVVDLALLPVSIRAQLMHEFEFYLSKIMSNEESRRMLIANTRIDKQVKLNTANSLELPLVNMLAIDSELIQLEINKNRDELIKSALNRYNLHNPCLINTILNRLDETISFNESTYKQTSYSSGMSSSNVAAATVMPKRAHKQNEETADELSELTASSLSYDELANFDMNNLIRSVEIDLNSYYICEKTLIIDNEGVKNSDVHDHNHDEDENESNKGLYASKLADGIVKLNKLDALASYKCVQKYKSIFESLLNSLNKQTIYYALKRKSASLYACKEKWLDNQLDSQLYEANRFFIIDRGVHYKCLIPNEDLDCAHHSVSSDRMVTSKQSCFSNSDASEERAQRSFTQLPGDLKLQQKQRGNSLIIENINKRQNYIFSKHLMSAFPQQLGKKNMSGRDSLINLLANESCHIRSIKLKQKSQNQFESVLTTALGKTSIETQNNVLKQVNKAINKLKLNDTERGTENDNLSSLSESINENVQSLNSKSSNAALLKIKSVKPDHIKSLITNASKSSTLPYFEVKESPQYYNSLYHNIPLKEQNNSILSNVMPITQEFKSNENEKASLNFITENQENVKIATTEDLPTDVDIASFETDRLKLDLQLNSLQYYEIKEQRDRVIIEEIDKMFATIRDHQSANAKAKGEDMQASKRKKSGSWGYSSKKRHVKAKIMELPFAEDLNIIARKLGINDVNLIVNNDEALTNGYLVNENHYNEDETSERVFVRIDDYVSREISHILQRSYSVDYLSEDAPRARIKYVKIPAQATIKTTSMLDTLQNYTDPFMIADAVDAATHPGVSLNSDKTAMIRSSLLNKDNTDYRIAPYDLKYWSIIKLLEEERCLQQKKGQQENYQTQQQPNLIYLDPTCFKYENAQDWENSKNLLSKALGKLNYIKHTNKIYCVNC